jgi:hypothetical protein
MPPLPVVPQVCKLVVSGTYHDTQWLNIYHVQYSGSAPSSSALSAYLAAIEGAVATAYSAEMSVDNEFTGLEITDLTSDLGATASLSASTFGTRTGDFNPANVAVVISTHISRRYRGGHPRKYLSWGTSGTFASGSTKDWDPGFITACEGSFNTMLAAFIGVTESGTTFATNVSVSYRTAGAVRVTAVIDPIVGTTMAPRVCSQRRRLGKVGG